MVAAAPMARAQAPSGPIAPAAGPTGSEAASTTTGSIHPRARESGECAGGGAQRPRASWCWTCSKITFACTTTGCSKSSRIRSGRRAALRGGGDGDEFANSGAACRRFAARGFCLRRPFSAKAGMPRSSATTTKSNHLQDFTSDHDAIEKAIADLQPGNSGTRLYDALSHRRGHAAKTGRHRAGA